jgi:hypothetical protein
LNVLDHAVLQELREALSADVLNELLRQVAWEFIPDSQAVVSLAEGAGWGELRLLSHRLAGTLPSFVCDALSAALHQVEVGLSAEPFGPPAPEAVERIVSLAKETLAALESASANT